MSKLGLVIVMMLMVGRNDAQNYPAPSNEPLTYFVLIQTDDGQVFYVRLNNQLYSSSPAGHLILSQLKDSVYTIAIGLPGQSIPEQRYLLNIDEKDQVLRLARQDNRWGLYDAHGKALTVVADPSSAERPPLTGVKKDDAFSKLMSAIVQDTAVMYSTYATASPDSIRPFSPMTAGSPIIHDSTTDTLSSRPAPALSWIAGSLPMKAADSSSPRRTSILPPACIPGRSTGGPTSSAGIPAVPSSPTGVVKLSERKSPQFLSLVFTDHPADKKTDTIDVNIPVDSPAAGAQHLIPPDTTHFITSAVLNRSHRSPQSPDTPTFTSGGSHKPTLPFVNSDCHSFATDNDVDKLRVRMLEASRDDDRIQAAYKVFKTKCFTTKQVRALSEVFTTDATKFKFLATAYPFVSDDNFSELVSLFSDPAYAGRFRTMTDRQ